MAFKAVWVPEGQATVRMKALTDEESDAMEMKLPCYVHGILKTESWAGTVRPGSQRRQRRHYARTQQ